jgi:flavin reductase (DIM6/NTAB) family NADH-FMN oxidoreductase RutF/DNA-binding MarR family transcriptional regulator
MVANPGLDSGAMTVVALPRSDAVEHGDPSADQRAFRRCLGQFPTGVTVITTVWQGKPVGVTASSFSSLSLDPPLVLWSIALTSRSCSAFRHSEHFAVNILKADQTDISQRFSTPAEDKFKDVEWQPGCLGSPTLPGILALIECATETVLAGGDHIILVGRVKRYARFPGSPLLYAQGRYAIAEDHPRLVVSPAPSPSSAGGKRQVQDLRLMALLAYVEMYASDAFDRYRQSEGLNLAQSRTVFALSAADALSMEEIVRRTVLPPVSIEDALPGLVDRHFVATNDGAYTLTDAGRALCSRLTAHVERFESEYLTGIAQQDITAMRRVLEQLYERLKPA